MPPPAREVRDDLLVVGELAVRADVEAEKLRRRLNGGGDGGGEEEGDREKRAFHAPGIMALNPRITTSSADDADGTQMQFFADVAGSSPDRPRSVLAGLILPPAAVMVSRFKANDCIYKGLSLKETRICRP